MDTTIAISDLTVVQLAERLASRDPAPGGGSASALAGAMAAGLVAMVAELTSGRPDVDEPRMARIRSEARERMRSLLALADEDAAAYERVIHARRMPKETDAQRAERSAAVRTATIQATAVPLAAARVAAEVAALAAEIAPIGNPNAISDAGVAAHLAAAALHGALLNVRINLPFLPADDELRATAPPEMSELERSTAGRVEEAFAAVAAGMEQA